MILFLKYSLVIFLFFGRLILNSHKTSPIDITARFNIHTPFGDYINNTVLEDRYKRTLKDE